MRVSELIKIYREEEKDLITPYFTGDFMLMTYLNDALVEFAKKHCHSMMPVVLSHNSMYQRGNIFYPLINGS